MQDASSQGVGEMVEGEGEETEDFFILLICPSHREQVVRSAGCVDGRWDVVQIVALVAGLHPFREMGVYVRHHKIHPFSLLSFSIPIHMAVCPRTFVPDEYVPTIAQFPEGFIHLLLYEGRRSAGTGAEIDECIVGDGRAEDGLEGTGNEAGRGCRLENWGLVFPEKSETCLDEGAQGSRKPRIGFTFLVFVAKTGVDWSYQDWSSISNKRSGGMGKGRTMAVDGTDRWYRLKTCKVGTLDRSN